MMELHREKECQFSDIIRALETNISTLYVISNADQKNPARFSSYGVTKIRKNITLAMKNQGIKKVVYHNGKGKTGKIWTEDWINYNNQSLKFILDSYKSWLGNEQSDIRNEMEFELDQIYQCPICYKYGKNKQCKLCRGTHTIDFKTLSKWFDEAWEASTKKYSFKLEWLR